MSDLATIPPSDPECDAKEALKASAHSRAMWLTKSDGTKVNLADVLCCIAEAQEPKPLILTMIKQPDCVPVLVSIPCDGAGGYDFESPTEIPTMAEYELPQAGGEEPMKVLEGEVLGTIILSADSPDTIGGAFELLTPPALTCKDDPSITVDATIDDLCSYRVRTFPCGTEYLTDPTDLQTATTVPDDADDRVFIGGKPIGAMGDDEFAGVNFDTPLVMGEGAVLCLDCVQFRRVVKGKAAIAALKG